MKLLSSILIATVILTLYSCNGNTSTEDSSGNTFNVMSYNIRLNTPGDSINAWPNRIDKVTGLIRFHQADIFGIQEALPEQMEALVAAFPDFESLGVGRDDGLSSGEHMSVFFRKSRFEKLDGGTFWLNEDTTTPGFGWDAACNRTCTWLKLRDITTSREFIFFNTHFDHRGDTARAESSKLILKFMKELNAGSLPFILTGDFNATKNSEPIQTIMAELKDSREVSESKPYGPEATSGGFQVRERSRIIDYIFINDKVKILRHGHLSDSYGIYYPSDHLPVLAEVELLP
ncbi:MAG TPA: endonuclease [Prolixibacteraceae bacterium]|nr:endonuclease [Prolixibacteraceae bacterium]